MDNVRLWQTKQKCPGLTIAPPSYDKYLYFSRLARKIYADYTDRIERFGLDECWLDVTGSAHLFGGGEKIAAKIRERIKSELGVTASIGVSYNKIFAKLGSDMKKPDATTVITRGNYKDIVWRLLVQRPALCRASDYAQARALRRSYHRPDCTGRRGMAGTAAGQKRGLGIARAILRGGALADAAMAHPKPLGG